LLLVGFWFRTYCLAEVPPGLHHDDIKNVILVERIMDGYIRIYYQENNGDEPLYHWMQALYFAVVGTGYPEVRLLSVWTTMVGLAATYALIRRLLGRNVALWTLAWHAVSLWSFFYARRAVRPVLLWPVAAVTGYLFIACIDDKPKPRLLRGWWGWVWAGIALGASLYIYQPGRVVPFFFLFFLVYLAVAEGSRLRRHWKGVVLFFVVGGLLFAPLGIYLLNHTEARVGQVNQPLIALKEGDPGPMWENGLRALGMFTFIGDPHWRQYVADTPVFEPLGAVLFYAGIVLVLWYWRRFEYAFVLLWVPVMLSPAIITEGAPNFLRPIAVLGTVYALPAITIDALQRWLTARNRRWTWIVTGVAVLLLVANGWRTYDGYFNHWAQHPDVRFAYNATIVDAGLYLNEADVDAVVLSGHFPSDLDPALVEGALRRTDLQPRWCDIRQSLVYPAGGNAALIEPDYFHVDSLLFERYMGQPSPLDERRLEDGTVVFTVYPLSQAGLEAHLPVAQGQPVGSSLATTFPNGLPDDLVSLDLPLVFGGRVALLGYEVLNGPQVAPGDVVTVVTTWQAIEPGPAQGITFLHLLDANGAVASGYDGFGAPPNRWVAGDTIVQLHRFALPGDLAEGAYPLELGWYERDTGQRWTVDLGSERVDRVLLEAIGVQEAE
jgi:hypothetical protein